MTASQYPDLTPSDLLPGDLGLTLGRSEISKLVAWVGDSLYSHAFLVLDQNELIEAAPGGVRIVSIAQRMREQSLVLFDVYRPSNGDGFGYSETEVSAIRSKARSFLRRGYPLNLLVLLGMMSAWRNWYPNNDTVRWILRIAMDALIRDDPNEMVCSELIFRTLREADVQPRAFLEPCILNPVRTHAAMPPINFLALVREIEQLFPKETIESQTAAYAAFQNRETVTEAELQERAAQIRAKYAIDTPKSGAFIIPNPNPKAIFPADLERSPSLRFIGRMRLVRDDSES